MKSSIVRKESFNSAHRLYIESMSIEENLKLFGKCTNEKYHGHNYDLYVKIIGEINPITGIVFDLTVLKDLINEHVVEKYDHKNLNLDVDDFKNLNPTCENIAKVIYQNLRLHIDINYDLKIKLYETPRIYSEYPC